MSACQQESVNQAGQAWCTALEELRSEIKELRAEHVETKGQLLVYLQKLLYQVETRAQTDSKAEPDSELPRGDLPDDHEIHQDRDLQDDSRDSDPETSQESDLPGIVSATKISRRRSVEGSPAIPDLCDLERMILRSPKKKGSSESLGIVPQIPQPKDEPPELPAMRRHPSNGSLRRRGSAFQHLARDSQAQILTRTARTESVCRIFVDNIGVSLWLNWSNSTTFLIVMMSLCYLVPTVILYAFCVQPPGEQWTAFSLMLFSTVALLLLHLVKRSLRSPDLNMALQQLDGFVQDCGRGLDWASVAKKHWCYFAFLWLLVLLAFTIQQFLEEIAGNREGWYAPAPDGSRWLRIFQAFASCILFAISSAVVMNGAYIQFNLLLGLGKTLDCWCADITETQDFISGIQSWNSLQALLKCVGREITPCFTALFLLGYVGFFAALAGSFALLLDDGLDVWKTSIYEWSLLPLLYLFYLSTRLCAKGASLSERCRQIPAFVNQLNMFGEGADTDRQYLVRYISDSAAGFIVNGVTLSQAAFLKQMHFLAAVFSGISGVLLRRYF